MSKNKSGIFKISSCGAIFALLLQLVIVPDLQAADVDIRVNSNQVELIQKVSADQTSQIQTNDCSENHQDHSQSSHHHCSHCPGGTCCAYLKQSLSALAPLMTEQKYFDYSAFWFYELNSSQLRPPSRISL